MANDSTLEQRTQTLGSGSFETSVPELERVHLISEIQSERLKRLRDQCFYTGNGVAYGIKDSDVFLYLTDFSNNPLMKDPAAAARALLRHGNFFVSPADAASLEAKAQSGNGVSAFNLSSKVLQKHLQRYNNEFSYIEVSTAKLAEGRVAFKQEYGEEVTALFDSVHGDAIYGENGIGRLLLKGKKETTGIWLLNPKYVKTALKSRESGTMIARASYLNDFDDNTNVALGGRYVESHKHMRGVVKEIAEGGAQKELSQPMTYDEALKVVSTYAPKESPLFAVLKSMADTFYRRK